MPDDTLVLRAEIPRPQWLDDPVISVADAAKLLELPENTLSHWLKMAEAIGVPMHRKVGGSRRMTAHDVFRAAILRALYRIDFPASNWVFRRAYEITHDRGRTCLPGFLDEAEFMHPATDGQPEVRVIVEISLIWLSLHPHLERLAT
ncbi:hypothetical protein MWN34_12575 [Ancylobacter sp. 6x-1]|uniref:DNA-binding protein n=1 Tax=Ancylobacter crimeensis TaxID=2579147 RepID=A0ABT0DDC4_9HYPH|nr:hypothetical protein [Ancylobacter crimeensis]MCK0197747.1 hypothetical protein [Ancylobacter crimeensis]